MSRGFDLGRSVGHTLAVLATALVTFVAAGFVVVTGPALWAGLSGATRSESMMVHGVQRHYRLYRPGTAPARPGLVIDLHPAAAKGFYEEADSRMHDHADRLGWLVAYPDSVGTGWEPYGCCRGEDPDALEFLVSVIDQLRAREGVDPAQVYVMGLSRGAMMAYRVACELSLRVTAIAAVEGNMADEHADVVGTGCRPARPVSVLAIHGTADSAVPFAGAGRYAPFPAVIDYWRGLDGCAAAAETSRLWPAEVSTWTCRGGARVRAVIVEGGRHVFPGAVLSSLPWSASARFDASCVIADFFAGEGHGPASR
jgi:polyhydroxybutyrate depolymerase